MCNFFPPPPLFWQSKREISHRSVSLKQSLTSTTKEEENRRASPRWLIKHGVNAPVFHETELGCRLERSPRLDDPSAVLSRCFCCRKSPLFVQFPGIWRRMGRPPTDPPCSEGLGVTLMARAVFLGEREIDKDGTFWRPPDALTLFNLQLREPTTTTTTKKEVVGKCGAGGGGGRAFS